MSEGSYSQKESGTGTLSPERFARVRAIFEAALEQPARDRLAFVKGACVGDAALLREVEAMLAADATGDPLLDRPPSTPSSSAPEEGRFPAGTVLAGRYRILGRLGQGGMGEVYRAHDLILNQTVALKFLAPAHLSEAALARFRNEVRIARQVSHPNVCRVYDLGMVEGLHFLSMEYIDGEDLASLLRRIGRLPQDKAVEFTRKICAGLGAAHERGVLHRDLKPANIMIDGRGQPRITDFGLAGLAAEIPLSDLRSGTPAYMSPEQKAGRDVTVRSDIYSLGLVLHEMFTGKARTDTQSNPTDLVKDLDPAIERLILRCLDEEPKRRPAAAMSVAMALPGGDPIAVALAAGETPSPEMVAAAGGTGVISPAIGMLCLSAIALGIAGIAWMSQRTLLTGFVPITKSREVMADRAARMVHDLGYPEPGDAAFGYEVDRGFFAYIRGKDRSPNRWDVMRSDRATALRFSYRQSRQVLPLPTSMAPAIPASPAPAETAWVILDPASRLVRFVAVPAREGDSHAALAMADWEQLFKYAGLDINRFTEVAPERKPPAFADVRKAWAGVLPELGVPVRIEAASSGGRPTYFDLILPWTDEEPGTPRMTIVREVSLLAISGGARARVAQSEDRPRRSTRGHANRWRIRHRPPHRAGVES
jgi:serine/threonine-protein kinase